MQRTLIEVPCYSPHVSSGLVLVDVYVEQLVLVHEVCKGVEYQAEGYQHRGDLRGARGEEEGKMQY